MNTNEIKTSDRISNTSIFNQLLSKLNGDNITEIIISVITAGVICFVCSNNGNLEITNGNTKVVLNSSVNVG